MTKDGSLIPDGPILLGESKPRPVAKAKPRPAPARLDDDGGLDDTVPLSDDFEIPPGPVSTDSRPHPVELPAPINPEGGRRQSVEMHRNLFCEHYDNCLDEAVKHGWNSFTCVRCSFYQEPGEVEGGLERIATQRRGT